jgi:hypothetical protein
VVRPPPWPKGWPATPLGGSSSSCTLLLSRFFFCNKRWSATPLGHWGGSATTRPTGLVVAEPPPWPRGGQPPPWDRPPSLFFLPLTGGGSATPLGHWGGSATTRPAGLVVAEPPPWPRVWPATPVGGLATSFFFFFLSFFFF